MSLDTAEEVEGGVDIVRTSSAYRRGIKPGSMTVPPVTNIDDARVFRKSTGTY